MDVDNDEEANEVLMALKRFAMSEGDEENDDDDYDDDERTSAFLHHVPMISPNRLLAISVRPSVSQSSLRPPSRVSCTIIYNSYNINQSVISVDSEVTGTTINSGVNGGSSRSAEITMQPLKTDDRP